MSSSKEFVEYIKEQLSELGEITIRPMMGEYLLYYRDRLAGGIYNDRLLIKPVTSALACFDELLMAEPYPGAKDMLQIENVDDRAFLEHLFVTIYDDLPKPKKKKSASSKPKAASKKKSAPEK